VEYPEIMGEISKNGISKNYVWYIQKLLMEYAEIMSGLSRKYEGNF
jgi:hypothetical protein